MNERERTKRGDGLRLLLLAIIIAGGVPAAHGFREDEVECEEAVAVLEECCPGFTPSMVECTYDPVGCDTTYPAIQPLTSRCIRDLSCAELRAQRVCEAAIEGRLGTDAGPEVCR